MRHLLFISVFILLFTSCSKDKLPKATEAGKNTFGCKIDGKLWLPSEKDDSWTGAQRILVSNSSLNGFLVRARLFGSSTTFSENVILRLPYLTQTGTYTLSQFGYGSYEIDYGGGPIYQTNAANTGTITITRCDIANHIYAGTFSFKAIDQNTGKVVTVTDGRFDVKRY